MDCVRHQCMLYEGSPSRHLPGIAAVISEKLNENRRCLYLNSPPMIAGVRSYLAAVGVAVAEEVSAGSLILSSSDSHLVGGRFDVDRMLALLSDAVDQALRDGYDGFFATGDMTWEFGTERNFEKLREYEVGLERVFQSHPEFQGICQYHTDTLPVSVAKEALRLHRACYINQSLSALILLDSSSPADISSDDLSSMMARAAENR